MYKWNIRCDHESFQIWLAMFLYSLCINMQIITNYHPKILLLLSHFKTILNGLNLQEVYKYCFSSVTEQIMIY